MSLFIIVLLVQTDSVNPERSKWLCCAVKEMSKSNVERGTDRKLYPVTDDDGSVCGIAPNIGERASYSGASQ